MTGVTIFVDFVEQIDVELSVLVVVVVESGQLVSTGVTWLVVVQLVTSGMVVGTVFCGQDFFFVQASSTVVSTVVWTVFVDQIEIVTVRGGG